MKMRRIVVCLVILKALFFPIRWRVYKKNTRMCPTCENASFHFHLDADGLDWQQTLVFLDILEHCHTRSKEFLVTVDRRRRLTLYTTIRILPQRNRARQSTRTGRIGGGGRGGGRTHLLLALVFTPLTTIPLRDRAPGGGGGAVLVPRGGWRRPFTHRADLDLDYLGIAPAVVIGKRCRICVSSRPT